MNNGRKLVSFQTTLLMEENGGQIKSETFKSSIHNLGILPGKQGPVMHCPCKSGAVWFCEYPALGSNNLKGEKKHFICWWLVRIWRATRTQYKLIVMYCTNSTKYGGLAFSRNLVGICRQSKTKISFY